MSITCKHCLVSGKRTTFALLSLNYQTSNKVKKKMHVLEIKKENLFSNRKNSYFFFEVLFKPMLEHPMNEKETTF